MSLADDIATRYQLPLPWTREMVGNASHHALARSPWGWSLLAATLAMTAVILIGQPRGVLSLLGSGTLLALALSFRRLGERLALPDIHRQAQAKAAALAELGASP